jgi:hypothetical protein
MVQYDIQSTPQTNKKQVSSNTLKYEENVADLSVTCSIRPFNIVPTFLSLMLSMSVSLLDLLPFIIDILRHSFVVLMSFASCKCIHTRLAENNYGWMMGRN